MLYFTIVGALLPKKIFEIQKVQQGAEYYRIYFL